MDRSPRSARARRRAGSARPDRESRARRRCGNVARAGARAGTCSLEPAVRSAVIASVPIEHERRPSRRRRPQTKRDAVARDQRGRSACGAVMARPRRPAPSGRRMSRLLPARSRCRARSAGCAGVEHALPSRARPATRGSVNSTVCSARVEHDEQRLACRRRRRREHISRESGPPENSSRPRSSRSPAGVSHLMS